MGLLGWRRSRAGKPPQQDEKVVDVDGAVFVEVIGRILLTPVRQQCVDRVEGFDGVDPRLARIRGIAHSRFFDRRFGDRPGRVRYVTMGLSGLPRSPAGKLRQQRAEAVGRLRRSVVRDDPIRGHRRGR